MFIYKNERVIVERGRGGGTVEAETEIDVPYRARGNNASNVRQYANNARTRTTASER